MKHHQRRKLQLRHESIRQLGTRKLKDATAGIQGSLAYTCDSQSACPCTPPA